MRADGSAQRKLVISPTLMASIPVHENYKDYRPPRYVQFTITELLSTLPEHYLSGLQSVVLTNAAALGKGKTGRIQGKKYL